MTPIEIVPPDRPEITFGFASELIKAHGVQLPALLGRRGYYRDSMGDPGKNDRGIYDDAIALVTPDFFKAWNANTDPSISRPGIALLRPGVWEYRIGTHGITKPASMQYEALVQADVVRVMRDGGSIDTGWFGINIHKGARTRTSSEGCQTIYPEQWDDFLACVKREMARCKVTKLPYVLTEREEE